MCECNHQLWPAEQTFLSAVDDAFVNQRRVYTKRMKSAHIVVFVQLLIAMRTMSHGCCDLLLSQFGGLIQTLTQDVHSKTHTTYISARTSIMELQDAIMFSIYENNKETLPDQCF